MKNQPLAELLRPKTLDEFAGLGLIDSHFVAQIRAGSGRIPSAILWGPPGSGKTTFAKIIGRAFDCEFEEISAVLSGVKDVRDVVERAKTRDRPTLLFVDEIHRFNKNQQDAFLPHVESGVISLVGATTENPSFYLTSALLSRCRLVVLKALTVSALLDLLKRAQSRLDVQLDARAEEVLCEAVGGDARRLLNLLESIVGAQEVPSPVSEEYVRGYLTNAGHVLYDRDGDEHYSVASAFIKSMRGSDPDAALYYGFRMLEGGEDPRFLVRRMVIFAAEDIGNADPRALQLATSTLQAFELVGLPEGRIPIAQCITYLATAPKSNRSYAAMHKALDAVKRFPVAPVPLHLRNAPTAMMKGLGYGAEYSYSHDTDHGYSPGVRYLPDEVKAAPFYEPSERGNEKTIGERMAWLRGVGKK
jgi:putative ATPase